MSIKKRSTLGKGLEALLGSASRIQEITKEDQSGLLELEVTALEPGVYQPRSTIREADLVSLADSIRAQGILQPILVRQKSKGRYEIIAGERRWRAAQLVGLRNVPVVVKEVSDEKAMAMALIENIQRENLSPLEEARAMERLAREFDLTHHQVAEAVGKSRAAVTNAMRLLTLSDDVKRLLEQESLEVGHAKVLLGLKGSDQTEAARAIISKGLSVRETEKLIARMMETIAEQKTVHRAASVDPDVLRLQNSLAEKLGASVEIVQGKNGKGKVIIQYNSLDELEGILAHVQ